MFFFYALPMEHSSSRIVYLMGVFMAPSATPYATRNGA